MNNPIEKAMEITGFSAERLAELLDVSKTTINNYRKNPNAMGIAELSKLSQETGISLDVLIGTTDPIPGPQLKAVYSKSSAQLDKAIQYAEGRLGDIERIEVDEKFKLAREEHKMALETFRNVIATTKITGKKPTVAALGPSDSGKSTLMNYLLGKEVIPAKYTPMTTTPTFVMHASEKPDIFEDPADNAVVFGRPIDSGKAKFRHEMLSDPKKAERYVIRKGNYESILKDFGTREGAYFDNETWHIEEIDIYVDAELLKEVTLVDMPGFGTGDRKEDDISLTKRMRNFDFVFFLSPADGFQRGTEAVAFLEVLRNIKGANDDPADREGELNRVFFLATHCNSIGNPDEVKEILHRGCGRLVKMMSDDEKQRFGITDENYRILEKRFFGFENTVKYYCEAINKDIEKNFAKVSRRKYRETLASLNRACEEYERIYKKELRKVQKGKGKTPGQKRRKKKGDGFLSGSKETLDASREKLKNNIEEYREKSKDEMNTGYYRIMNTDNIKGIIEKKGFKNKKADIEALSNYLSSQIGDVMSRTIKKHGKMFADEIDAEIENYKESVSKDLGDSDIDIDVNGFDFTRAFAAGLSGVTAYGALALWATIAAAGSNLGAYIAVAKVVSVLGALGISVGGTGAAVSAVSAIGGPITLGIALAVLAAVAVFGIFTGTWKARVASRLIKEYSKERVLSQYEDRIDAYWDDTEIALEACFDELQVQTANYYEAAVNADELSEEDRMASGIILENLFKLLVDIYAGLCDVTRLPGAEDEASEGV